MDRALASVDKPGRAAPGRVVAVVQAAGQRIGIDGAHVVQAIIVPSDMGAVPRRAGGIVGVITRGAQLVPVIRLENWLQDAASTGDDAPAPVPVADARIVIIGDRDRVVGLLVDAVIGMQRCGAEAISRLFHDERPDELFASVARLEDGAPPLALLEPARLAALAGTWCAAAGLDGAPTEASPAAPPPATCDDAAATLTPTKVGIFRIADRLVGIPVEDIGEFVTTPALRAPPIRHPSTRGLCDWRGRLLPVSDIGGLLGAAADALAPAWMCVVRRGDLVLGVLVDEVIDLQAVDVPPQDAGATASLVRHAVPIEGGILQVLDTAVLMAQCPESAISLRGARDAVDAAAATTSPHLWLVFDSGGSHAARIDHIQEIVPLPATLRPRLDAGLDVSLPWRGHAVPVRGLFAGRAAAPADARLLVIVVAAGHRVAVPITAVRAMIAPRSGTLSRLRVRAELVEVVSTTGADRATYEVVNLEALAGQGLRAAA